MHIKLLFLLIIIYIYCNSIYFSLYKFKTFIKNKKDLYLNGELFNHNKLNRKSIYDGTTDYIIIPKQPKNGRFLQTPFSRQFYN